MNTSRMLGLLLAGALGASAAGVSHAQSAGQFGPIHTVLSNPCATFYESTGSTGITKLVYGEPVNFTIDGNAVAVLDPTETGFNLKFLISAHGQGVGGYSGIKYVFNGKLQAKANVSLTQEDVKNPAFQFNGSFKVSARVIGQGSTAAQTTIAQGAQDNAVFDLWVRVRYVNGQTEAFFDDVSTSLTLTCQGSPWANQTTQPVAGTRKPAGRGFGDEWNKYAWSMQDFNGGLLVGTKNANYKFARILGYGSGTSLAAQCFQNQDYPIPTIYKGLACAELFESPAQGNNTTDTRFAEIWRFDYARKTWSKVRDDGASQGFRIMATHGGKLYVGSDLGSFIAGVDLKTGTAPHWNYPGSKLLVSSDGRSFEEVPCSGGSTGPCTSANPSASLNPDVNISFRALASYGGKLYLGTFNPTGGELWAYTPGVQQPWEKIHKFSPANPAVTELVVFKGKLYIGLGGGSSTGYLYTYDGTATPPAVAANLPSIASPSHIGVLKLFVSSKGTLYVGNVDLLKGFALHTLAEPGGSFTPVTLNGFGDPDQANNPNAYAWSMAEIDGRVFLGSFNTSFFGNLPRGSAELWYSDDQTSWTQMALPLDFGFWNYGIRGMVVANRQLFLGTASAIVAPDLIEQTTPISAGLEVWSIRSNTAKR